ncbi:nuclear transport factor 2 family protein [Psychrosphaera aquimarina]|uniref:Nuclear transport factor 2 family protein n=1 Tax=Psychrosphaera aquimarina TaxID=2044854 RepID=A0ABU3R227_9GAMM|nr:nuclear transport factor 2 family protein [Psychrosphaera aquimarina]MDU0113495.1 nuclear transport factor 2 family protein [Psychrosphaera aquimarina]
MKKLTLVFIFLILSFSISANEKFTAEQLIEKAKAFVSAKNARQQPNTTIKEIDHFLSLLSDNFIDEHVKYNFTYTDKSKLRSDLVGKLKDEIINSNIEINEIMVGANVVFIKMTEIGKVKPAHLDKTIEYSKTNIVSLEFNESGLVKHIRRHHG